VRLRTEIVWDSDGRRSEGHLLHHWDKGALDGRAGQLVVVVVLMVVVLVERGVAGWLLLAVQLVEVARVASVVLGSVGEQVGHWLGAAHED